MRPLILVSTINSRHWNTCYLQLLSVQRCQPPPQAERSCLGGGPDPPSSRALLLGGGPDPPSSRAHGPSSPPPLRRRPATLHPRLVFERYARGGCVHRAFEPNTPSSCRVLAFY